MHTSSTPAKRHTLPCSLCAHLGRRQFIIKPFDGFASRDTRFLCSLIDSLLRSLCSFKRSLLRLCGSYVGSLLCSKLCRILRCLLEILNRNIVRKPFCDLGNIGGVGSLNGCKSFLTLFKRGNDFLIRHRGKLFGRWRSEAWNCERFRRHT